MPNHSNLIVHRLLQRRITKHANLLEAHKLKGPAFKARVEQLQQRFEEVPCPDESPLSADTPSTTSNAKG